MKVYQACYSHPLAVWELLNCSEDIPQNVLFAFEDAEKRNQDTIPSDGQVCSMLELIGGQDAVGLVRVQYGMNESGAPRPVFFAQGFMYDHAYDLLKDPDSILSISDSNYSNDIRKFDNYEELIGEMGALARECVERTRIIPSEQELKREPVSSVAEILTKYKITLESYLIFVSTVTLFALYERSDVSIFVRTDGTKTMMRDLLKILFEAIPYSLRTRITAASRIHERTQHVRLVFTNQIPERTRWIDPVSGKQSVYPENVMIQRMKENPQLSYGVKQVSEKRNSAEYFDSIENWLEKMGDISLFDKDSILLAHKMVIGKIESEDLDRLLDDWLVLDTPVMPARESVVNGLLQQVVSSHQSLHPVTKQHLDEFMQNVSSSELKDSYISFCAEELLILSLEEASGELRSLEKDPYIFEQIIGKLSVVTGGTDVLRQYYLDRAQSIVNDKSCSFESLREEHERVSEYSFGMEIDQILADKLLQMMKGKISAGLKFDEVVDEYIDKSSQIAPDLMVLETQVFLKEFWNYFMKDYKFDNLNNYQSFFCGRNNSVEEQLENRVKDYPEYQKYIREMYFAYDIITNLVRLSESGIDNQEYDKFNADCIDLIEKIPDHQYQKALFNITIKTAREVDNDFSPVSMDIWTAIFQLENLQAEQIVEKLINFKALVLLQPDILLWSLGRDYCWKDLEFADAVYSICKEKLIDTPYRKSILSALKGHQRELEKEKKKMLAEEKKRKKNERRQKNERDIEEEAYEPLFKEDVTDESNCMQLDQLENANNEEGNEENVSGKWGFFKKFRK